MERKERAGGERVKNAAMGGICVIHRMLRNPLDTAIRQTYDMATL
ncbi:MAG: hypothetical protein RL681_341 [Candidatus Parcubacteria bacterium]